MKKFAGIVLAWLCMVGLSWGGVLGDVNGDGDVGLPEAVHALQVSSGIRPQGVTPQYDFADYFMFPGTFERKTKYYRDQASGGSYTYQGVGVVTKETVDGEEYYFEGYYYYRNTPQGVLLIGFKGPTGIVRYDPPTLLGSRNMSPGDVYTVFYEPTPGSGSRVYREDTFLETEDVTTAAGFFPGCLKMRGKVHGSSPATFIRYFARGIGKVKEEYLTTSIRTMTSGSTLTSVYLSPSSYSTELVSASIGGNVIPANVVYYSGSGKWTQTAEGQPTRTGDFTWRFTLGKLPSWGSLVLKGFNSWVNPDGSSTVSDLTTGLSSEDGVTYTDAWRAATYPTGYTSMFSLTVSDGNIAGTIAPNTTITGTYTAE